MCLRLMARSKAVVMAEGRFAQELEPPQCLLPESKQNPAGISATVGAQVFIPPALFCYVCMMQGWQICCWTELLLSCCSAGRCPGGSVWI